MCKCETWKTFPSPQRRNILILRYNVLCHVPSLILPFVPKILSYLNIWIKSRILVRFNKFSCCVTESRTITTQRLSNSPFDYWIQFSGRDNSHSSPSRLLARGFHTRRTRNRRLTCTSVTRIYLRMKNTKYLWIVEGIRHSTRSLPPLTPHTLHPPRDPFNFHLCRVLGPHTFVLFDQCY